MTNFIIDENSVHYGGRTLTMSNTQKELQGLRCWTDVNEAPVGRQYWYEQIFRVTFCERSKQIIGFGIFAPADAVMPDGTFMGEAITAAEKRGWKFSLYEAAWIHPNYPTLSFGNEVEDPFNDQTGVGTVCMMFLSRN